MVGFTGANERVEPSEDLIDRAIVTSAIVPTLNHSLVVAMNGEVPTIGASIEEVVHKTLKANSFGPVNVALSVQGLPSRDEPPDSPHATDDDGYPDARAHIREHSEIEQLDRGRDDSADGGLLEEGKAPDQVGQLSCWPTVEHKDSDSWL